MHVKWLLAQDGLDREVPFISVPTAAKSRLLAMASDVIGNKDSFIAIYLPINNNRGNEPGHFRGRIIGAVTLREMKDDESPSKFCDADKSANKSWPHGWPCETMIRFDPIDLREILDNIEKGTDFTKLTRMTHFGPVKLTGTAKKAIEKAVLQAQLDAETIFEYSLARPRAKEKFQYIRLRRLTK